MDTNAAYLRISSDKQDVSRQRQSIEAWADRNGPISFWFEDSTGKNPRDQAGKREGFQRMLKTVEAGLIETIVVDSLDRFGTRDAHELGSYFTILRNHGCRLVDASGKELSGDDDASVLTSTVGALTSTREQKEKAKRSIGGKIIGAKAGEYQGGYPAYGFDVVCFGADGREKWRSVYVAHYDRWKVMPDGSRERFQGKDNSPRKDATDEMRYRPSIEAVRLKMAKQIFKWYATESISPRQIATRLNELKVDPVFGESWDKVKVAGMLRNPVYIGRPAWNKRAGSRFVEYVGGVVQDVPKSNGKVKQGRRRETADHIEADKPQFPPVIDAKTWERVQAKLEAASAEQPAKRPPRTAELWLRPFVVCGHCGKPMHCTNGVSTARLQPSYFCSTYSKYGPANPSGCHCHRVQHGMIERIVLDYVKKTTPKIASLLAATTSGDLEAARPLLDALTHTAVNFNAIALDMQTFVDDTLSDRVLKKLLNEGRGFPEIYGLLFEKMRPAIERQIVAKDTEIGEMLDQFRGLSPRLKERLNAKMEALQAEIDSLKRQLNDLREPWGNLKEELGQRRDALAHAGKVLSNGAAGRQKTEALTQVVDKVVLYFRHTVGVKNNGKSYLERVEITAVSGDSICYLNGSKPGPG